MEIYGKNHWKRQIRGVFFVLAFFLMPAWGTNVAGYIDDVNGPPSHFVLISKGKHLLVFPAMLLRAGDEIHILKPTNNLPKNQQSFVRIILLNGNELTITYENTPYIIKDYIPSRNRTSFVDNLSSELADWLRKLWQRHNEEIVAITK
jgi:hypothetical protein